ncbi:MAG: molybdopterin-dependent oxidoreductase [Reyranella sp.]|nr:molybdopterin-dependent oxidoreductase [Reyranella sp.]
MAAIHFGPQGQPATGWGRRRFLIGSTAAGIMLALVPPAARASFVDDEIMPTAPGWSGDGLGQPRYRIDGYAKVTGAKLYARDFRAADMDGWPDETDHAMLLLASDATRRFVGADLTMLAPALQPDRVVTAEDLEAARIRAKGFFTEDLMCRKGQTPAYLGQPVALLIFSSLKKFVTARQILRGARGTVVFGEQTGAVARPPYGANRFTRIGGSDPSGPDVFSPVMDGWVVPPRYRRGHYPSWPEADATAMRRAEEYGRDIRADLEGGRAGRLFKQRFQTQSIDPFFMEPESGLAWHDAANNRLSLVLGVQAPADTLRAIADILSDARTPYAIKDLEGHFASLGGAFGGKDMPLLPNYVALAGLFADGRPVRLALDRFEQFQLGLKRHAVTIDSQLAVDPDGAFTAFACDLSLNGGGTANYSASVADIAAISSASMYYVPKSDISTVAVHSRGVTAGSMRGFGGLQSITAMECLVDDVAAQLDIDPIVLRRKNAMRTGYRNLTGAVPLVALRSEELLDRLERAPLWSGRHEDRRAFEAAHPYKAYGVGVACAMFKYGTGEDGALAAVSFDAGGRIEVAASTVEMGTGTSTAVAVRVADHLGRIADKVTLDSMGPLWEPLGLVTSGDPLRMSQQDQDAAAANPRWVPHITSRAGASAGAPVTTHTVAEAAYALLRHSLWPAAREIWQSGANVAFGDLKWIDGKLTAPGKEPLSFARLAKRCHATSRTTGVMVHAFSRWRWARAEFAMGTDIWNGAIDALALRRGGDWRVQDRLKVDFPPASTERASETYAAICGAVVALSVDRTNGAIKVLRVHEVLDCGRAIVPELVSGMAHGGIAMGLGHALAEYLPLYEDGPGNGSWNINRYDVARARDVPVWEMTLETLPSAKDDTPRGIAEIVMVPVIPATLNAIHDATGNRFTELPVTADDILKAR